MTGMLNPPPVPVPDPAKSKTVWLAVYAIPPQMHPLAVQGGHLIGYDIWSGLTFPDEGTIWPGFDTADVARIRSLPQPYGVHVTLGDPLEYPISTLPTIIDRLEAITTQIAPFTLRGASYAQHFWDTVMAITWEQGINKLQRLAIATAVHVNTLRYRLPRTTVPMTTQPYLLRDWAIETTFGRHWTIDKFFPHLTLGNALHNRMERDQLWATWQRLGHVPQDMSEYDLEVRRVYLVTNQPDSRFWKIHPDYPMGFELRGS